MSDYPPPPQFDPAAREDFDQSWRDAVLSDLPEPRRSVKAFTFPSAYELIKIAAYNRRMTIEDFIGRAALAVAVYDSGGEHSWKEMTRPEPGMKDLRRRGLPLKRHFGEGFGPWKIGDMS